jgi:hypothetical protein
VQDLDLGEAQGFGSRALRPPAGEQPVEPVAVRRRDLEDKGVDPVPQDALRLAVGPQAGLTLELDRRAWLRMIADC